MPDFEALIRHQQLRQPSEDKRLKVVNSPDFVKETEDNKNSIQPKLLNYFIGGFVGSLIGTLTILFLFVNEYLPMDLMKIN